MKVVIYYNEKSTLTHLSTKEVDDNYTLKPGETFELPSGFLTPAKLVNGVLTSASVEESNQVAKEYLKENGLDSDSVSAQQQIALLSTQIALTMGTVFSRLSAIGMLCAYLGSFFGLNPKSK